MKSGNRTLKQLHLEISRDLQKSNIENADLEARWYLEHTLNISENQFWISGEKIVVPEAKSLAKDFVRRRRQGEPFAYIIGVRDFYGREFIVNRHTLIPRPETEIIVDEVLNIFADRSTKADVADFGAGSGCLGLTLLCERPNFRLLAVDVSADALAIVEANASKHKVTDRIQCILGDIEKVNLPVGLDLIVANPPYIDIHDEDIQVEVKKFEPHLALFSEDNGFAHIKAWVKRASETLRQDGLYLCEIGAKQADKTVKIFENLNLFSNIRVLSDLSLKPRVVVAQKK